MSLAEARGILARARSLVVLTGAGVSAESGIPTFRDSAGLRAGARPEDAAGPGAFERDPRAVWGWYDARRAAAARAEPNPGHLALARIETRAPDFTLATQNVDGLHARAGSRRVLELHGSLWTVRCTSCLREEEDRRAPLPELPPRCACGGLLRPGVVWFGEGLDPGVLGEAWRATDRADVLLVAGTSSLVQPAASIADAVLARGAAVLEVNLEETPLSGRATISLRGRCGDLLPRLLD
jgi:NAD-dependent deacetylase